MASFLRLTLSRRQAAAANNTALMFRPRPLLLQTSHWLSSQPPKKDESPSVDATDNTEEAAPHKQEFVTVQLEPGEWDGARRDPLHRPPWRNRARIISEEDYANRPRVGFEEEFDSLHDAMVVLSWMDRKTQELVYDAYLSMMESLRSQNKKTSHEYVMKVIGQQFNITAARAAAIVQLLHNEDQIRKHHPEQKLYDAAQEYADAKIQEHISNAYGAYRETPPGVPFVEDPMGVDGLGDVDRRGHATVAVDDLKDVLDLTQRAIIREQEEAKLAIDGHVYEEDVDETKLNVNISGDCQKLLSKQHELKEAATGDRPEMMAPLPDGGETRPRWKYVAQTINTRESKKKKMSKREKRRNRTTIDNTLVEQNGELRVASVAEAKGTAWKPVRNELEFTFGDVKQAWLRRTLHGEVEGWGRIKAQEPRKEEPGKPEEEGSKEAASEAAGEEENEAAADEESSSSSEESASESSSDETEKDNVEPDEETPDDKDDK